LILGAPEYAQEIQKIVVFEGAFDRLFNIIKEEGGSEGGIIVQVHITLSFELVELVI
jgi:hypothetical protein